MIAKERRILVAVDEGEESLYALTWCLNNVITQNSKDTLILLYAKPPRYVYTALDGTGKCWKRFRLLLKGVFIILIVFQGICFLLIS